MTVENAIQNIKYTIQTGINQLCDTHFMGEDIEQYALSKIKDGVDQIIKTIQLCTYSQAIASKKIDQTNWHIHEVPLPDPIGDRKVFIVTSEDDVNPDAQLVLIAIDVDEVCEQLIQIDSEDEALINFVNTLDFIEGDFLEDAFQVVPEKEIKSFLGIPPVRRDLP